MKQEGTTGDTRLPGATRMELAQVEAVLRHRQTQPSKQFAEGRDRQRKTHKREGAILVGSMHINEGVAVLLLRHSVAGRRNTYQAGMDKR
jgi:hypothetical protein